MRIGTASHLVCKTGRRMSWRAFEVPEGRWVGKGMLEGCDSLNCPLLLAFVVSHFVVCICPVKWMYRLSNVI